jgi:hypothetical protein
MKIDRPTGPQAPEEQAPVGDAGAAKAPGVSFAETLGKAEGAAAVEPSAVEALLGRMQAGEIGIDAVLDTLVEQSVQGAPLGPKGKQELREILRVALENDPTLRRLTREIQQG